MTKHHNYGIDLLRIVLMLFIISGHLLVHTNIRSDVTEYSSKWGFTWIYQTITVCAVNCFILITGYFSSVNNHSIRVKKIALLYGQVLFYSVVIYSVLVLLGKVDFSIVGMIHSLFPLMSGQYWFFSSFILLMLLMPFINHMLGRLNDYCLKTLIFIIVIFFYILPIFSIVFIQFDLTEGMGIIGFTTLYMIGYSLKRLDVRISKLRCVVGLFINCMVVFGSKIALTYVINTLQIDAGSGLLYHYNSIFQLINAVLLLLLFKQINIKGKLATISSFVSSSVFGVYLLHEHPDIRKIIWNEQLYNALIQADAWIYICMVVLLPLLLFILCLLLDKVRSLVGRLLAKTKLICRISESLTTFDQSLKNKFEEPGQEL